MIIRKDNAVEWINFFIKGAFNKDAVGSKWININGFYQSR